MEGSAIRLARDALATRDLRRLQLAAAAAGVGGWAFMISLAVYAYAVGGAAAVGLAALVRMAPAGLAAPLTGLAADRFSRRDVLLAALVARALLLGAAALVVALGGPLAVLLVLATLFTVAATAHKPAQAALLPRLAPERERQAASNALWTAIDSVAFVAGAIGGGVLVATFGAAAAFAASGAAFVAAALALAQIARDPAPGCAEAIRREPAAATAVVGGEAAVAAARPRWWAARPRGRRGRGGGDEAAVVGDEAAVVGDEAAWWATRALRSAPGRRASARGSSWRSRDARRSRAFASSRATGGCGSWSASSRRAPSSRGWSTCSWSSPRCGWSTSAAPGSAG